MKAIALIFLLAWAPPERVSDRQVHAKLGECLVDRQASAAARYVLDVQSNDAEARRMHSELPLVGCWERLAPHGGAQLKLPGDALRYALAEALVRAEYAKSPVPALNVISPLAYPSAVSPPAATILDLTVWGECIARRAPAESRDLLLTRIGSAEENARLANLATTVASCRPHKTVISENSDIRGPIALGYYRLAKHAEQRLNRSGQ